MKFRKMLVLSAAALMMLPVVGCGGSTETATSAPATETPATQTPATETPATEAPASEEANRNYDENAWQIPAAGFDATKDVEITFYSTMGDTLLATFDAYLADFNAIYPNIKVTHTQPGGYDDVLSQISTELSTGDGPDIAYCYADHVALYNKTKSVVTLDNLIQDDELGLTANEYNDFIKGYYNEGKQFGDGLMYTLPFSKSTEILYYNKDVFTKEGLSLPTHWFNENAADTTSMEYVCATLKEKYPDSTPLGYDSGSNWFITMTEQMQTPYTSATGDHFLFNTQENRDMLEKFKGWYDKGYVTTQDIYGSYTSALFVDQKSFMSIGSSAGATHQVVTAGSDGSYAFETGMAEIPQMNENNKKVISQGPSLCIFNHGDSQKVIASWLLMKYFTTNTEFQAQFSIDSGYVPVIKSVSENEIYKTHLAKTESPIWITGTTAPDGYVDQKTRAAAASAKICLEQEENYFTSPAFIGSSIARTQVGNMITQYFTDKKDLNTAFKDAVDTCNANI